jgi:hypothetical protein
MVVHPLFSPIAVAFDQREDLAFQGMKGMGNLNSSVFTVE